MALPQLPDGWTVEYEHSRERNERFHTATRVIAIQGWTKAIVKDGEEVVARGMAVCGVNDQFCYRLGRTIALGRALKRMR